LVAYVLRSVPELDLGVADLKQCRDFRRCDFVTLSSDWRSFSELSICGYRRPCPVGTLYTEWNCGLGELVFVDPTSPTPAS